MQKKQRHLWALLASVAISVGTGWLSGFLTRKGVERYQVLQKPPLTPPSIVFPIVWTILFVLMGISAWLIWKIGIQNSGTTPSKMQVSSALQLYAWQLIVNFLWSILFFNLELRLFSLFWLLLLLAMVSRMVWKFYTIGKGQNGTDSAISLRSLKNIPSGIWAALLQVPYLLWLMFAAYLNLGVWFINR